MTIPAPSASDLQDTVAVRVDVDVRATRITAVKKALYWLQECFDMELTILPHGDAAVVIAHVEAEGAVSAKQLIERTLLDFEIREIVAEQTGAIRSAIVAAAIGPSRSKQ